MVEEQPSKNSPTSEEGRNKVKSEKAEKKGEKKKRKYSKKTEDQNTKVLTKPEGKSGRRNHKRLW